jgi:O-antigen ligase
MMTFLINLIIFLVWLLATVRYRIELGPVSFAVVEPAAVLLLGVLLSREFLKKREFHIKNTSFVLVLASVVLLALLVRPMGESTTSGLSDVRDWAVPVLTFIFLVSFLNKDWQRRTLLFITVALLNSLLGVIQHITNNYRFFGTELSSSKGNFFDTGLRVSAALGFFEHPNSLATYLLIGILITLACLAYRRKRIRLLVILAIFIATLYWTYAKTQILILGILLILFWFGMHLRSVHRFFAVLAVTVGIGLIGVFTAMHLFRDLFGTFWWRVNLWDTAIQTFRSHPETLILGNGDIYYVPVAVWPNPHNIYIHALLQYGLVGLCLLLLIGALLLFYGIKAYQRGWFHKDPLLLALWLSIFSFFLNGLAESSFIGIETRMIFCLLCACFFGRLKEIRLQSAYQVQSKAAHSLPLDVSVEPIG